MVGAGAIAAVANTLGRRPFPFVFGGDGVSLAVSGADAPATSDALAAMASFARAEFKLDLRVAMIPVSDIRASGNDIRVARFAASEHCIYAMFSGGGLTWFEAQAKNGRYPLPLCSSRRSTQPFRTVVPMGRRARAQWSRPFGHHRAARQRPALRPPCGRHREDSARRLPFRTSRNS